MKNSYVLPFTIVLAALATAIAQPSSAQLVGDDEQIIDPETRDKRVKAAEIDTERFELGVYAGLLSVENFNTNPVGGLSFSFHVSDDWMLQINAAASSFDLSTREENLNVELFPTEDETVSYADFSVGYKLLDGRSYFSRTRKYDSALYVVAGAGAAEFVDHSSTLINFGLSYRSVITDYLTFNVDIRNRIFEQTSQQANVSTEDPETESTNNGELTFGLNFLF